MYQTLTPQRALCYDRAPAEYPDNIMEPMVNIALRAARKAGNLIARASDDLTRLRFEAKGKADFVTEVDLASEQELITNLQKTYPDHAFICEESGRTGPEDAEFVWIIDPLDGTSNFMRGIPHYCISMACVRNGKLEHAIILDPVRQEEFTASRGRGAQLNGRRIRVSDRTDLKECLIGTGTPFLWASQKIAWTGTSKAWVKWRATQWAYAEQGQPLWISPMLQRVGLMASGKQASNPGISQREHCWSGSQADS